MSSRIIWKWKRCIHCGTSYFGENERFCSGECRITNEIEAEKLIESGKRDDKQQRKQAELGTETDSEEEGIFF